MKIINKFSGLSQLRSKAELSEFYKTIHPDMLGQAPEKVKQENLRSLTKLNYYFDTLATNSGVPISNLNFYLPEKDNRKSKKYYFFEINLKNLDSNVKENLLKHHFKEQIKEIQTKLIQAKSEANPMFKKMMKQKESNLHQKKIQQYYFDKEKVFEQNQYTIGKQPKQNHNNIHDTNIKEIIFNNIVDQQFVDLVTQVEKHTFFQNSPSNKPMMWSRVMMENSSFKSDIAKVYHSLIDPRLVFVSEKLQQEEIEVFNKSLLDYAETAEFDQVKQVFLSMESSNPQICLLVCKEYKGNQIPGFFKIPFDFEPYEMKQIYFKRLSDIQSQREKYEKQQEKNIELKRKIEKNFGIQISIELSKNIERLQEQTIFLLKIQDFLKQFWEEEIVRKVFKQRILKEAEDVIDINHVNILIYSDFKIEELKNYFYITN